MFIRSVTNYTCAMPDDPETVKDSLRGLCGDLAEDLRPVIREGIKNLLSSQKEEEPAPPVSEISPKEPSPPASKYFG